MGERESQRRSVRPPDGVVFETERFHASGGEKVAAVQDQWAGHGVAHALPVENAKFIPFCEDEHRVNADGCVVGVAAKNEFRIGATGVRHGLRIEG